MKPTTQKIALILTALVIQANAQKKPAKPLQIKKTTVDLTYGSINAGTGGTWPTKYGYLWKTTVAGTDQNIYVNFNDQAFYTGSKAQAGWGVDCTTANQCKTDGNQLPEYSLNQVQVTVQPITVPLTFGKSGTLNSTIGRLIQKGDPYNGASVAGLGFASSFWLDVRIAALIKDDPVSVQLTLQGQKNLADNMISEDANTKNIKGTLTFLADAPKNPIKASPLKSSGFTDSKSLGITGATVTLPYTAPKFGTKPTPPKNNIITLVKSTDVICIAPELPYVFVADVDAATNTQILDTYSATVCPDAKNPADL